MKAMIVLAPSVFLALLAAAGCGGGGDGAHYTKAASEVCLAGVGVPSDTLDGIAQGASEGGLRLDISGKEVMVAFGRDGDEAKGLSQAYEPFGGDARTQGNVVMAWTDKPSDDEAQALAECLAEDAAR